MPREKLGHYLNLVVMSSKVSYILPLIAFWHAYIPKIRLFFSPFKFIREDYTERKINLEVGARKERISCK